MAYPELVTLAKQTIPTKNYLVRSQLETSFDLQLKPGVEFANGRFAENCTHAQLATYTPNVGWCRLAHHTSTLVCDLAG